MTAHAEAAAAARRRRVFEVAGLRQVTLASPVGVLRVERGEGGGCGIELSCDSAFDEVFRLDASESPGRLDLRVAFAQRWRWGRDVALRITLRVPDGVAVDAALDAGSVCVRQRAGALALRTRAGDIELAGVDGDADCRVDAGDLRVDGLRGRLDAKVAAGRFEASRLSGSVDFAGEAVTVAVADVDGALSIDCASGAIRVERAGAAVAVRLRSGDVDLEFARGNAAGGVVEVDLGRVNVALDAAADVAVSAEVVAGTLDSRFALETPGAAGCRAGTLRVHLGAGEVRLVPLST